MTEEIRMDLFLPQIKTLYDQYHEHTHSLKKYNRKYNVEGNKSLFCLEKLINKSYEQIVNSICRNDAHEISALLVSLHFKADKIHLLSLSEIAHKKLKQIDFEKNNPYLYKSLRKEFRILKNKLDELDDKAFFEGLTEDIISEYQEIIYTIQNLEENMEDEKKSGLYSQIPKIAYILAPILLTIEGFILAEYIVFNPYIPLIGYILVLFLAYFILKSPTDFSLLYMGSLNKKNLFLHFVLLAGMATYGIAGFSSMNSNIILKSFFIFLFFIFVYVYFLFIKTLIVIQKKSIIDKEFTNIYEKYVE